VLEIASCLHNLGELEAAKAYYEQAIELIRKAGQGRARASYWEGLAVSAVSKVTGVKPVDLNHVRVQFIKSRLLDIELGRLPDPTYLDSTGTRRRLPEVSDVPLPSREGEEAEYSIQEELSALKLHRQRYDTHRKAPAARADSSDAGARHHPNWGGQAPWQYTGEDGGSAEGQPDRQGSDRATSSSYDLDEPSDHAGGQSAEVDDPRDAAEIEAARKEWLEYYFTTGDWSQAAELVATREEEEDLRYLMQASKRGVTLPAGGGDVDGGDVDGGDATGSDGGDMVGGDADGGDADEGTHEDLLSPVPCTAQPDDLHQRASSLLSELEDASDGGQDTDTDGLDAVRLDADGLDAGRLGKSAGEGRLIPLDDDDELM